jgi:trehalose synthase
VLAAFVDHVPIGTLALVGPDPDGVPDDVDQGRLFSRTQAAWRRLSRADRDRVHLVCLPMADLDDNALLVNALQRASTVVVQKSLAEGFGLTVTEAMWKSRPVVASAVGGIRAQITHGHDGLLTDPHDLPAAATLIISCMNGRIDTTTMGTRARERVLRDFLPDREVTTMADVLTQSPELGRALPPR